MSRHGSEDPHRRQRKLIIKILFVGDVVNFVVCEFECIVGAVEVSADDGGLDGIDEEDIEDV